MGQSTDAAVGEFNNEINARSCVDVPVRLIRGTCVDTAAETEDLDSFKRGRAIGGVLTLDKLSSRVGGKCQMVWKCLRLGVVAERRNTC